MCSRNSSNCLSDDDLMLKDIKQISDSSVCMKCRCKPVQLLLRKKDGYCKDCFLTRTTHKFRAAIGKAKIIRRGDSVLIGHSGESNSTALLHLIKTAMHETAHKRLVLKIIVLYIDEGSAMGQTIQERQSLLQAINKQVEEFKFTGYVVSLEQSLKSKNTLCIYPMNEVQSIEKDDENLIKTFKALSDNTARKELQRQLRYRLLVHVAEQFNCNRVFVANSSTNIAVQILSDVSLGRGAHLPLDIDFSDVRYKDVMVLRPMRDFTEEEIVQYLKCHDLIAIQNSIKTQKNSTSIQSLTEQFVRDLDNEYQSTVSTIFRTGEKLCTESSETQESIHKCVLCHATLDTATQTGEVSAIQAAEFSKSISSNINIKNENSIKSEMSSVNAKEIHAEMNGVSCCNTNACKCSENNPNNICIEDVMKHLCYGCRLIFSKVNIHSMPMFIVNAVQEKISLMRMEEQISDFLL